MNKKIQTWKSFSSGGVKRSPASPGTHVRLGSLEKNWVLSLEIGILLKQLNIWGFFICSSFYTNTTERYLYTEHTDKGVQTTGDADKTTGDADRQLGRQTDNWGRRQRGCRQRGGEHRQTKGHSQTILDADRDRDVGRQPRCRQMVDLELFERKKIKLS